jgi:AP-1 complex subunit gamma-1
MDTNAVQRHRNTILDCLRDGDISIRRRALELSYALTNEQNVRVLIRELLAFLEVADNEFKLGMTTQISVAAERFAPNKRWHIDTVLRTLKLVRFTHSYCYLSNLPSMKAGNFVREEILAAFIRLVAHTPELQGYTASRLYHALQADISQESLTLAAAWIIGEYSDILVEGGLVDEEQPTSVRTCLSCGFSLRVTLGPGHGCTNCRPHYIHPRVALRQLPYATIRLHVHYEDCIAVDN